WACPSSRSPRTIGDPPPRRLTYRVPGSQMKRTPKPGSPRPEDGSQRKAALEERIAAVLSEIRDALGPKEGARFANAAFSAGLGRVFGPADGDPAPGDRGRPPDRKALRHDYRAIIGESPALLSVLAVVDRIASSDLPVLVTGESGTGKELVARAIHEN